MKSSSCFYIARGLLLFHIILRKTLAAGTDGFGSRVLPRGALRDVVALAESSTLDLIQSAIPSKTISSTEIFSQPTPSGVTTKNTIVVTSLFPSTASYDIKSLLGSLSSSLLPPSAGPTSVPFASGTTSTSSIGMETGVSNSSTPAAINVDGKSNSSPDHHTLVIALSVGLGVLGVFLIGLAIFLICRKRRGRSLNYRGATPIHDDEIATWRSSGATDRERTPISAIVEKEHIPAIPELPRSERSPRHMHHGSNWSWNAPPSPTLTRPGLGLNGMLPDTPSVVARAPNARAGLTDEAKPGEEPFVQSTKRQSSRLSKAPPGHARSKSRRSSMSAKSVRSVRSIPPTPAAPPAPPVRTPAPIEMKSPTWFDPDDDKLWTKFRDSETPSLPDTPGAFMNHMLGGLSPRPATPTRRGLGRNFV